MGKQYGQSIPVDAKAFSADPRAWLVGQMNEEMPYLLVHADDGVIWGKRQPDGVLRLSSDVFSDSKQYPSVAVSLRATTLQEGWIFGKGGELRLWRTGECFDARLLVDSQIPLETLADERYLLWYQGNPIETRREVGFSLLQEGQQGQRHAPPVIPQGKQRPKLVVRHYVGYDQEGQAYIALSRLVGLEG